LKSLIGLFLRLDLFQSTQWRYRQWNSKLFAGRWERGRHTGDLAGEGFWYFGGSSGRTEFRTHVGRREFMKVLVIDIGDIGGNSDRALLQV
jgi:hypothetical protein